jgi:CheY-like chemotaxis protein
LKPRGQLFNITSLPKECHIFSRSPEIAEALNRFLHANGVNTHQHNDPMMLNVERDSLVIVDDSMLSTGGIHRVISLPDEARARLVIMINPLNLQLWQHLESHGCSGLVWKPVAIGSLFWSYPQREEAPVAMVPSAPLEQRQLSVLIADDIPTNTIILSELLREAGHTVTMVENGKELCDRLGLDGHENGEEHFDIVFTDLQMPILDGRGAIKRVRASSGHYSHVPIVVVTADGYEESHRTLIEEGANAVMVKPFNEDKLNALLINLTRGGGRDVTEHT